jgi:hypothetical protein
MLFSIIVHLLQMVININNFRQGYGSMYIHTPRERKRKRDEIDSIERPITFCHGGVGQKGI